MHMLYYTVICGLTGSKFLFHIISQMTWFLKKMLLNIKCVFWFSLQLLSETFLIIRRTERDMIKKMYIGLLVKYRLFLSYFNDTWIFLTYILKILKYQKFHGSLSSGSWVVPLGQTDGRTDGRTDMMKLIVTFHNFANTPNKDYHGQWLWGIYNVRIFMLCPNCRVRDLNTQIKLKLSKCNLNCTDQFSYTPLHILSPLDHHREDIPYQITYCQSIKILCYSAAKLCTQKL